MTRSTISRAEAVFLAVAGVFGLISDLLSYSSGTGRLRHDVHQNATGIGVVEAHSLAVLTGVTHWYLSQKEAGTFGIGWGSARIGTRRQHIRVRRLQRTQAETQGVAVTIVHFVFVALNAVGMIRGDSRRVASSP